jgi:hypothetical protein
MNKDAIKTKYELKCDELALAAALTGKADPTLNEVLESVRRQWGRQRNEQRHNL